MKVCTKCGLEQQEENYYVIKSSGNRHGSCKSCFKKKSKASAKKLGRRHRKNIELLHNYGITIEQFDQMMEDCNSQCVCGATKGRANKEALHVDHDHSTGQVRGLLCHSCNRTIGLVEGNVGSLFSPNLLRKLADYMDLANSRSL